MSVIYFGLGFEALATLSVDDLTDGDQAYIYQDGAKRTLEFNATSTDATDTANHPYKQRPSDYATAGVWIEDVGEGQPEVDRKSVV